MERERHIIFASKGDNFADAARLATLELCELINQYRNATTETIHDNN